VATATAPTKAGYTTAARTKGAGEQLHQSGRAPGGPAERDRL